MLHRDIYIHVCSFRLEIWTHAYDLSSENVSPHQRNENVKQSYHTIICTSTFNVYSIFSFTAACTPHSSWPFTCSCHDSQQLLLKKANLPNHYTTFISGSSVASCDVCICIFEEMMRVINHRLTAWGGVSPIYCLLQSLSHPLNRTVSQSKASMCVMFSKLHQFNVRCRVGPSICFLIILQKTFKARVIKGLLLTTLSSSWVPSGSF